MNDGVVAYPTSRVLPTAPPGQISERLAASGLTDPVGMSYDAFLINTGSKLVLIDTGTGKQSSSCCAHWKSARKRMPIVRGVGPEPELGPVVPMNVGPRSSPRLSAISASSYAPMRTPSVAFIKL